MRAYARMINTGELGHLAPLLAQNFRLTSQNVLTELASKDEFVTYMEAKLQTLMSGLDSTVRGNGGVDSMGRRPLCCPCTRQ